MIGEFAGIFFFFGMGIYYMYKYIEMPVITHIETQTGTLRGLHVTSIRTYLSSSGFSSSACYVI